MNDLNRTRELEGVVEACKFLGVKRGLILTNEDEEVLKFDDIIVDVIPAYKWLLSRS